MENKLAKIIVDYSLELKENEKVLITTETDNTSSLVKELIKEINNKNAVVNVKVINPCINSYLQETMQENKVDLIKNQKQFEVDNYDAFIMIRYSTNDYNGHKANTSVLSKIGESTKEIDKVRINDRKWVLLNYPSILDSHKAKMTNEEFYNYAMNIMTYDYKKMGEDLLPLRKLLDKTKKVKITGPNTNLTFSIEGIPNVICSGINNIPDGEIFTAPIKNSVEGIITFNTPSPYQGYVYNNICLEFKKGKIVKATCASNQDGLNRIFETDEGAKYIGEFSIGVNPLITSPVGDILYDEKITGSLHFTPGRCYDDAFNGNISSVHWDLVLIQTEKFGGGEIYFDDVLIRKNGLFVLDSLKHLNYK